ncbi:MAG: hypothetical protein LBI36_03660 [Oscillospiraceae bacterium]|jgi:alpha-tubulin suppressor-like RCC1 family protein|nr:hypothetical protein [Oscillospiraceae bacterium]
MRTAKILTLVLALVTTLVLAACGAGGTSSGGNTTAPSTNSTPAQTQAPASTQEGGDSDGETPPDSRQIDTYAAIAVGEHFTAAIKTDGSLWTWKIYENNPAAQLGTDTDWVGVYEGFDYLVAHKSDGSLWAWGRQCQLGDGTTKDSDTLIRIGSDNDWKSVFPARYHVLAIKNDGSLWGWGMNSDGQIGVGTVTDTGEPVSVARIGADSDWVCAAAGHGSSYAIKTDGTLWAWGLNGRGQLGFGTTEPWRFSSPAQVGTDNDWASVSAAEQWVLALKTDGTLWAWGSNGYGCLGLGDDVTYDPKVPMQVGSDADWSSALASGHSAYALKKDGSLWSWGYNYHGNLGDGTKEDRNTPAQVGTDTDWAGVTAGGSRANGLKSDGSIWAWGSNFDVMTFAQENNSDVPVKLETQEVY